MVVMSQNEKELQSHSIADATNRTMRTSGLYFLDPCGNWQEVARTYPPISIGFVLLVVSKVLIGGAPFCYCDITTNFTLLSLRETRSRSAWQQHQIFTLHPLPFLPVCVCVQITQ